MQLPLDVRMEATGQRQDLMKPVNDLFGELKERLNKLPSEAQKVKFEQQMKDQTNSFNRPTSQSAEKQSAPAADQPAVK